jgi:hypothetical protein
MVLWCRTGTLKGEQAVKAKQDWIQLDLNDLIHSNIATGPVSMRAQKAICI